MTTRVENRPALPVASRRRLRYVGLGWALVAALEAAAYTALAWAIAHHQPPAAVLFCAALAVVATVLVTRAGFFSGARLAGDLYAALGSALAHAKLSWFTDARRAQLTTLANQGIPGFTSIPAHQLQTFIHAPLIPLFLLPGVAWLAGAGVAAWVSASLAVSFVVQLLAQRALGRADARRHEAGRAAAQATLELVNHLELLRTAAGSERALARIEPRWRDQEHALAATNRGAALAMFAATVASVLPLAAAGAVGLDLHEPADVLALLVLVARAAAPLGELALAALSINDLRAALHDYRQAISAPALPEPHPAEPLTQPASHHLAIRQISHAPVLHNVNADIPPGSTVLISGASGSGKSTLLELLLRFDDPQQGSITLGGVALNHMRHGDLLQHMACVTQDPVVFTGTLADNIRLGRADASDVEVEAAARQAALGSVLDRSPQGIHQTVGHQGSALSGGERQRVALARALLKHAPILLLDEATSALDEATERAVARVVRQLPATVIVVTHRNPDLWQADQRLALGGGDGG